MEWPRGDDHRPRVHPAAIRTVLDVNAELTHVVGGAAGVLDEPVLVDFACSLRLADASEAPGHQFCRCVILCPTCGVQGVGETGRLNGGYLALRDH